MSLLAAVIASLSACKPSARLEPGPILTLATPVPVVPRPNFYVSISRNSDHSHALHGLGWVPGSSVEVLLLAEPIMVNDGRELASANPRVVATVTVGSDGTFGVTGPDINVPIEHVLCGYPPQAPPPQPPAPQHRPQPVFLARDLKGNLSADYPAYLFAWFTHQACR